MMQKRFEVKEKSRVGIGNDIQIIVDKETGVNYLVYFRFDTGIAITPLLGADGKPVISK